MKVICIGRNYADHAKELNNPLPEKPVVFMKPSTALLVNNKPFFLPDFSREIHHELEVVLKICRNGRHIEPRFAHKYFSQVGLGIDFTARDVQAACKKKGHPWEIAKAFDDSAPLGKFYSKEELELEDLRFELYKNGNPVQLGNTRDMIFSFAEIISYVSRYFRLLQGDLIFTGTPAGVGPVQRGDVLEAFLYLKDGRRESVLRTKVL